MSNLRPVICLIHGERPPTLVCKHLVDGKGLGFHTPDRPTSEADADVPSANVCGNRTPAGMIYPSRSHR